MERIFDVVYTIESKSDVQQSIEENRAQQRERRYNRLNVYIYSENGAWIILR